VRLHFSFMLLKSGTVFQKMCHRPQLWQCLNPGWKQFYLAVHMTIESILSALFAFNVINWWLFFTFLFSFLWFYVAVKHFDALMFSLILLEISSQFHRLYSTNYIVFFFNIQVFHESCVYCWPQFLSRCILGPYYFRPSQKFLEILQKFIVIFFCVPLGAQYYSMYFLIFKTTVLLIALSWM